LAKVGKDKEKKVKPGKKIKHGAAVAETKSDFR
jgi:hypothetical protein